MELEFLERGDVRNVIHEHVHWNCDRRSLSALAY